MIRPSLAALFVAAALAYVTATAQQAPPAAPQRPTFRGRAMLVNVDAYPTRDGHIVTGLTPADFQLSEDGVPQKIEAFEFLHFDVDVTASQDRHDPGSREEGDRLAGDPHHRVFVAYFDPYHLTAEAARNMRAPVIDFLHHVIGPSDYFAAMTPAVSAKDLVFGQRTETIEHAVDNYWPEAFVGSLARTSTSMPTPLDAHEEFLRDCYGSRSQSLDDNDRLVRELFDRWRSDLLMTGLHDLVLRLRSIRDGRTNVLLFASPWTLPGVDESLMQWQWNLKPQAGIVGGKLTGNAGSPMGMPNTQACDAELMRLSTLDSQQRFRDLLTEALRANVAFTTVDPAGLGAFDDGLNNSGLDMLRVLANSTNGTAIVATNDLQTPLRQFAEDTSSYYLLGYYTTNQKLDGKFRTIDLTVTTPGVKVVARRGYLGPTEEMLRDPPNAAASSGGATAAADAARISDALNALAGRTTPEGLAVYAAASPGAIAVVAEIDPAILPQWPQGGDVDLVVTGTGVTNPITMRGRIDAGARSVLINVPIAGGPWQAQAILNGAAGPLRSVVSIPALAGGLTGDPLVFHARPAVNSLLWPAATMKFMHSERLHIEWPAFGALDRREARVLDRTGKPLPLPVALTERDVAGTPHLIADLLLAPLAAGDYLIELTTGRGATTERKLVAIHVDW